MSKTTDTIRTMTPLGRPTTRHGNYDRQRQLGRVSDEDWQLLRRAAQQSGDNFTAWATKILVRSAKRQLK